MHLLLLIIACQDEPASAITTAGDAEKARAALIPECDGMVHDTDLFNACALERVTQARTAEAALEFCARLEGADARCRAVWVERMMNRAEAPELRTVCGEDADCLAKVDEAHAWKERIRDSPTDAAQK